MCRKWYSSHQYVKTVLRRDQIIYFWCYSRLCKIIFSVASLLGNEERPFSSGDKARFEKASSHQDRTFQHGSAEFSAEEAGKGGGVPLSMSDGSTRH